MEKIFKIGQFFFFLSYMTLKYLLIIDFPKFDPLTAEEMALCGNLSLSLSLSLRLSRIREYKYELNLILLSLRLS
jgi:hypothetical protein